MEATHPAANFSHLSNSELSEDFEKVCAMENAYYTEHGSDHPLTRAAATVVEQYMAELDRRGI